MAPVGMSSMVLDNGSGTIESKNTNLEKPTEAANKRDHQQEPEDYFEETPRRYRHDSNVIRGCIVNERNETDILCGRGVPIVTYRANIRMHRIIEKHRDAYQETSRRDKPAFINEVVDEIKMEGCRFLKKTDDDQWEEMDNDYEYEKVSHALRCRTHRQSKQMAKLNQKQKERASQVHFNVTAAAAATIAAVSPVGIAHRISNSPAGAPPGVHPRVPSLLQQRHAAAAAAAAAATGTTAQQATNPYIYGGPPLSSLPPNVQAMIAAAYQQGMMAATAAAAAKAAVTAAQLYAPPPFMMPPNPALPPYPYHAHAAHTLPPPIPHAPYQPDLRPPQNVQSNPFIPDSVESWLPPETVSSDMNSFGYTS